MHYPNGLASFLLIVATLLHSAFAIKYCQNATVEELISLSGYVALADAIRRDFGRAPKTYEVNTGESHDIARPSPGVKMSDMIAEACMDDGPHQFEVYEPSKKCKTFVTDLTGTYDDATGELTVQFDTEYKTMVTHETSRTSKIGGSLRGSVNFDISSKISGSTDVTVSLDVANTQKHSNSSMRDTSEALVAIAPIAPGQFCQMAFNTTTCQHTLRAVVPISFSGWVQLKFRRRVTYADQGFDKHHKYWWVNVTEPTYGLTSEQLSDELVIEGDFTMVTRGDVYVKCRNGSVVNATQSAVPSIPSSSAGKEVRDNSSTPVPPHEPIQSGPRLGQRSRRHRAKIQ